MSVRRPNLHTTLPVCQGQDGCRPVLYASLPPNKSATESAQPNSTGTPVRQSLPKRSKNHERVDKKPQDLGYRLDAAFVQDVAITFVVFGLREGRLKVLSHRRTQAEGGLLPGGLLHAQSRLDQSARKHLELFADSDNVYHQQLQVFDDQQLDTGSNVLRVVYYALLSPEQLERTLANPHCETQWHCVDSAMSLMDDHKEILHLALQSLRNSTRFEPTVFHLLPEKFTLTNLQEAYEAILGVQFRKSNFRRKIAKTCFLMRCQERQKDVAHRAAELYRFEADLYREACENGFVFSL